MPRLCQVGEISFHLKISLAAVVSRSWYSEPSCVPDYQRNGGGGEGEGGGWVYWHLMHCGGGPDR